MLRRALAVAAILLLSAACAGAAVIDADAAYERSQRAGRDDVEGFWSVRLLIEPDRDAARSFRVAIVKNDGEHYGDWDYVGAVTCSKPGCRRGEIRLLLRRRASDTFDARILYADRYAEGTARLGVDPSDGRPNSGLDMSGVLYDGRLAAEWFLRIVGR